VWIHAGEPWTIDQAASFERIAHHGRGGYCYHVNGAFAVLLRALGYDVTLHIGGVHGSDGPSAAAMTNHLVLTVAGLASDECPDGHWYVDAGLGDGLCSPLPLRAGTHQDGLLMFVLDRVAPPGDVSNGETPSDGWHLTHDPTGSFAGMSFAANPTPSLETFADRHVVLSTSPDSSFTRTVTVQRRLIDGTDILRGCVLQKHRAGGTVSETIDRRDDWFAAIHDIFGLDLSRLASDRCDALWQRVSTTHRDWLAAQSG
jgi:N-hydroxyarylamine O-acetyltransferase